MQVLALSLNREPSRVHRLELRECHGKCSSSAKTPLAVQAPTSPRPDGDIEDLGFTVQVSGEKPQIEIPNLGLSPSTHVDGSYTLV